MSSSSVIPASERAAVAAIVDHTLLKTDATHEQVAALIAEAQALGTHCICVSPSMLPLRRYTGPRVRVCSVVGFPSGKHASSIKAAEAAQAVKDGADEVDMVIDVGAIKEGAWDAVEADVAAVRAAVPKPTALLKVILETAALTDEEITRACQACERAGADYVKTSTGFHASGGASVKAVTLMRAAVGDRLGVKASGGIKTAKQARELITAGASRLGLSGTKAILDEIYAPEGGDAAPAPAAAKGEQAAAGGY